MDDARRPEPPMPASRFQRPAATELAELRARVRHLLGLAIEPGDGERLARRVRARLLATGCTSYAEYSLRLADAGFERTERGELIELLWNQETYFFRQPDQLMALAGQLAADRALSPPDRPLRMWSAGCASGEEAYSLAILLQRDNRCGHIVATDHSTTAIDRARVGRYGLSSFRATEPFDIEPFFVPLPDGRRQIRSDIQRRVRFVQGDLLGADRNRTACADADLFDVVLCRHVLMYLTRGAREQLVATLVSRLASGGLLLLGHAESLLWQKVPLEALVLGREVVYRRPAPDRTNAA